MQNFYCNRYTGCSSTTVGVSVTAVGNFAGAKSFKESGANITISKPKASYIVSDDKAGTISGFAVSDKGAIVQILASGLTLQQCSGCNDGTRHAYSKATVVTTGNYKYVEKTDFTCELEIE